MAKRIGGFNGFDAQDPEIRGEMRRMTGDKIYVLNPIGQEIVSSTSGVPLEEIARFAETGAIQNKSLSVLYKFYFGYQHPSEVPRDVRK